MQSFLQKFSKYLLSYMQKTQTNKQTNKHYFTYLLPSVFLLSTSPILLLYC